MSFDPIAHMQTHEMGHVPDGNIRQTRMEVTVTIPARRRAQTPRFSVRGEVMATFYPKDFNRVNSRVGTLFLRKFRGNRWKTWESLRRRGLLGDGAEMGCVTWGDGAVCVPGPMP